METKTRRKSAKVTQSIFDSTKLLIARGITYEQITDILGISAATIKKIKKAKSLDDYRRIIDEYSEKSRAKKRAAQLAKDSAAEAAENVVEEKKQTETVPNSTVFYASGYQMHRLIEELRQQNEYLKNISNKLAYIVEQLS